MARGTAAAAYTEAQRSVALAFLESLNGDVRAAAKKAKVGEAALRFWASGGTVAATNALEAEAGGTRPQPPDALLTPLRWPEAFAPSPEMATWVAATFLTPGGPLYNADHSHLRGARLAFLWTNVPSRRQGKEVAGTCGIPTVQGDRWTKSRADFQLTGWFGDVPHFLITLDSVYGGLADDARFCALVEHELYHAAQAEDEWGCPRFTKDGQPVYAIAGHDVEEFVGVMARYGADACAGRSKEFVAAASRPPLVAGASVGAACGTCLK